VILLKILKDFRLAKGKLILMLLAASISAWGISSVVYSYMMAERDFQVNFARTFPADFEIMVENYTQDLEDRFLADENVIDIERREAIGGRIRNRNGNWIPLILYAVDDVDNMRLDKFRILEVDAGSQDNILIETNAAFFLDPYNDSIEVQFSGESKAIWKKGGTAHDARLAPAKMEGAVVAYATSIDMVSKYMVEGRRRLLIETNVSSDMKELQETSERLKSIAEQEGSRVVYVSIPTPGQHIHQNIVDGVSFLQQSMGTILAVMGIILLSLILLTWIFPQVRQMGVMKAIGASTQRIFFSYVIVLSLIVVVGLIVGMPLGYKTAMIYSGFVGFIQNFEPVTELLPVPIHVLVVLLGVVIPLLFGRRPLSKAAKTSVNEAMNKTFYTPNKAIFYISQNLIHNSRNKYAINNMFRNSQRTILLIFLTAIGLGLFFTGSNLEYSVRTELNEFASMAEYNLRVRFSREMEKEEISFLYDLPFVESITFMKDKRVTYRPPSAAYKDLNRKMDQTFPSSMGSSIGS